MARPRKPTQIKKLQGTLQRCRTNFNEPVPQMPIDNIEPPGWLSDFAKDAWRFAVSQMPEGMLTSLDWVTFTMWADTYSKIVELDANLRHVGLTIVDEKKGIEVPNPMLREQTALKQTLAKYLSELGFTPASRSRVSVNTKKEAEKNPFIDL